jgi:hypothetical protein
VGNCCKRLPKFVGGDFHVERDWYGTVAVMRTSTGGRLIRRHDNHLNLLAIVVPGDEHRRILNCHTGGSFTSAKRARQGNSVCNVDGAGMIEYEPAEGPERKEERHNNHRDGTHDNRDAAGFLSVPAIQASTFRSKVSHTSSIPRKRAH